MTSERQESPTEQEVNDRSEEGRGSARATFEDRVETEAGGGVSGAGERRWRREKESNVRQQQ